MRLDYSEKKGAREYIERSPLKKNRPRKEPSGFYALFCVVVLLGTFGAGVLTGKGLSQISHKTLSSAPSSPAKKEEQVPAAPQPAPALPLTFYKTLSDGGRGAIGSGLNPKKTAPTPPQPAPVAAVEGDTSPEEEKEATARFVVQIASYHNQEDAEKAKEKLFSKGIAAYITETKLKDNLVWYRLRVGRHLTKGEAEALAGKAGKGALVLPE
jgi:cell division protein FtsN